MTRYPYSLPSHGMGDEDDEVIHAPTASAPRTATTDELKAAIQRGGGALVVAPYSSEWLLATNDWLHFNVERQADGRYKITQSSTQWYLLGGGALLLVILLTR